MLDCPIELSLFICIPYYLYFEQDSKWKKIGEYSGRTDQLSFTRDVIFPGRTTAPKVGSGKIIYTVAAFFPKDQRLGALSELGMKWVCIADFWQFFQWSTNLVTEG